MNSRLIIIAIEADGWYEVRQKGDHVQFKHLTKPGCVTFPHPKPDVANGTIKSIEKQSGVKLRR